MLLLWCVCVCVCVCVCRCVWAWPSHHRWSAPQLSLVISASCSSFTHLQILTSFSFPLSDRCRCPRIQSLVPVPVGVLILACCLVSWVGVPSALRCLHSVFGFFTHHHHSSVLFIEVPVPLITIILLFIVYYPWLLNKVPIFTRNLLPPFTMTWMAQQWASGSRHGYLCAFKMPLIKCTCVRCP